MSWYETKVLAEGRPFCTVSRCILSLALLTGLVYASALGGGFILDDETIYLEDPGLARQTVQSAFGHPPEFLRHPSGYYYYRPLSVLAHSWLLRTLGLRPFLLHLVSVALHGAASVVVFLLALEWGAEIRGAWLAAAIFLVHPLHVEAVAWMAGLPEVLGGVLMLLSLYTLLRARSGEKWWLVASYFAAALALGTKETAFALPLLAAVLVGAAAWPFFALAAGALLLRVSVIGTSGPALPTRTPWQHLSVVGHSLLHYTKKLIVSWPLALDYDLSFSAATWAIFASGAAALVWVGYRSPRARTALLLSGAALVPPLAGSLTLPLFSRAQDRYAYVAVFGFALLVTFACRIRWGAWAGLALVALWSALSVSAITHWRDAEALWSHTLEVTPKSKNAVLGLGEWYFSTARFSEAVRIYEHGLAFHPRDRDILQSLASARRNAQQTGPSR